MSEDKVLTFQERMLQLRDHLLEKAQAQAAAPVDNADLDTYAAGILVDAPREQKRFERLMGAADVLGEAARETGAEMLGSAGIVNFSDAPVRSHALVNVLRKGLDETLADYCGPDNFPPYHDGDSENLHDQIVAFGNQLRKALSIDLEGRGSGGFDR